MDFFRFRVLSKAIQLEDFWLPVFSAMELGVVSGFYVATGATHGKQSVNRTGPKLRAGISFFQASLGLFANGINIKLSTSTRVKLSHTHAYRAVLSL